MRTWLVVAVAAVVLFGGGVGLGAVLSRDGGSDGGTTTTRPRTSAPTSAADPALAGKQKDRVAAIEKAGKPGEETTGVFPGTQLTPAGDVVVKDDGAVLEGLDIDCLRIQANDVTVRNSRIRCGSKTGAVRVYDGMRNAVLEDVEIDGLAQAPIGIGHNNYTLRRANLHNSFDGARAGSDTTIEDSWIHGLARVEGSHNDGVQTIRGTNIVLRGNTIDIVGPGGDFMNAAYIISPKTNGAPVDDVLVEGNYFNGGNYTLYLGGAEGYPVTNLVFRDNVVGGDNRYGELRGAPADTVWEGNTYADGRPFERTG